MALKFDSNPVPDARETGTVALLQDRSRAVVLLCDGGGSWGAGIETAAWSLQYLQRRWSGARVPEPTDLLADLRSLRSIIPKELLDADFGCSFCVVLLDCSGSTVRYFASGRFSVVLFDGRELRTIFQPNTLGAELIKQGNMTEDEARPFRLICCEPFMPDEALDPEFSEAVVLTGGCYLLVLDMSFAEKLDVVLLQKVFSSPMPAEALQAALGAEITAVIVAG